MEDDRVEMVAVPRHEWLAVQERLARLEQVVGSPGGARPASVDGDAGSPTDRRAVLKRGALLAAGAAAGAAALTAGLAQPATAADGDSLVLGTTNTATEGTALNVTGSGGSMPSCGLSVIDNALPADAQGRAGLLALARGTAWGVAMSATGDQGADALNVAAYGGGFGVSVVADQGVAMRVASQDSTAVTAIGGLYGLEVGGVRAALHLGSSADPPPQRTDPHIAGEVDTDTQSALWLCVADGTPGTWVRLGAPGSAGAFSVLPASVRVYDSRPGQAPTSVGPKSPLGGGTPRTVDVTVNGSGVPADANAVCLNLTAVPRSLDGYLAAYKAGIPFPGTSTLNWGGVGVPVANAAVVALAGGQIALLANASTDVIVDVVGYYR